MQCPKCHNEVNIEAKYCPHCGSPLDSRCPNCQHKVSPEDKFCSNCGYQLKGQPTEKKEDIKGYYVPIQHTFEDHQEETPIVQEKVKEKVRWKPIIISAIVLVALTIGSLIYLGSDKEEEKKETTVTQKTPDVKGENSHSTYIGNVNMEGEAYLDQDTIYMTNEKGYLVSLDKKLQSPKVLLEEKVTYITPYQDKIYFADENNYLSVVDKNGKNKETIVKKPVYYLVLIDDQIYYQLDSDQESLYVLDIKTKKSQKINDSRTYSPNITDQYIYYSSSDGVYQMDKDGKNDKRIIEGKVYNVLYEDNKLYYIQDTLLYCYDLKTKAVDQILDTKASTYIKNDQTIYAYTMRGLVSYDMNTKKTKTLYAGSINSMQVIGDIVLVKDDNGWMAIMSDGSQYQVFQTDNGDFV